MATGMRTKTADLLDEVAWMLAGQMHPALIAQELHRKRSSILNLAQKHGRKDIAEAFKLDPYMERSLRRTA